MQPLPRNVNPFALMLDPQAAIDRFHERGSLLSKATVACYVDPRSAAEYAEGHLPGAINVPLVRMPEEARALLAGHDLFIVYGSSFQDPMAKAGATRLIDNRELPPRTPRA
jgi:rhodanese-related sulfurtransferase